MVVKYSIHACIKHITRIEVRNKSICNRCCMTAKLYGDTENRTPRVTRRFSPSYAILMRTGWYHETTHSPAFPYPSRNYASRHNYNPSIMNIATASEFMAVNLRGRGRSPEAKDSLRCMLNQRRSDMRARITISSVHCGHWGHMICPGQMH